MRTTVFAFMGLMAAAGLALVAIFAQLGFPLLEPAPLPSDPSRANAVAEAEVVAGEPRRSGADGASRSGVSVRSSDSDAPGVVIPADGAADGPSSVPSSPAPERSTDVAPPTGVESAPAASKPPSTPMASAPVATPAPTPTSSPAPEPVSSPPPPEAPAPPPAPPAASTAGGPPPHSSAGGNGNGKALGLSK